MKSFATSGRALFAPAALALVAMLALAPGAGAQIDPTWDHYKVYDVQPPLPRPAPIVLRDQFGEYGHDVLELIKFANPTEKMLDDGTISPIQNPQLHYAWWLITPQPFDALVAVTNQLGDQTLRVRDSQILWNPALKNEPGEPPLANHYKCYDCDGTSIDRVVTLTDQFGQWQATVTFPRFFCNPVEKTDPTGLIHPIEDMHQHYVVYDLEPYDTRTFTAIVTDQFVFEEPLALGPSYLLCVPTLKLVVTPALQGTWGRLKTLYR